MLITVPPDPMHRGGVGPRGNWIFGQYWSRIAHFCARLVNHWAHVRNLGQNGVSLLKKGSKDCACLRNFAEKC